MAKQISNGFPLRHLGDWVACDFQLPNVSMPNNTRLQFLKSCSSARPLDMDIHLQSFTILTSFPVTHDSYVEVSLSRVLPSNLFSLFSLLVDDVGWTTS